MKTLRSILAILPFAVLGAMAAVLTVPTSATARDGGECKNHHWCGDIWNPDSQCTFHPVWSCDETNPVGYLPCVTLTEEWACPE